MGKQELAKVAVSGRKIMIEYIATVNKVQYYTQVGKPDKIYTALEIRKLKR